MQILLSLYEFGISRACAIVVVLGQSCGEEEVHLGCTHPFNSGYVITSLLVKERNLSTALIRNITKPNIQKRQIWATVMKLDVGRSALKYYPYVLLFSMHYIKGIFSDSNNIF